MTPWSRRRFVASAAALGAIEAHGYRFHSSRSVWEDDQRRENGLVEAGWKVLKVTSSQLENEPASIIGALRSLLGKKPRPPTKKRLSRMK